MERQYNGPTLRREGVCSADYCDGPRTGEFRGGEYRTTGGGCKCGSKPDFHEYEWECCGVDDYDGGERWDCCALGCGCRSVYGDAGRCQCGTRCGEDSGCREGRRQR